MTSLENLGAARSSRVIGMLAFLESLCSPGMRLMQRLRMPAKFVVIALAFLVPLSVTLYAVVDYANAGIDFGVAEKLGVAQLRLAQGAVAEASNTSTGAVGNALGKFADAIASDHDPLHVSASSAEAREAWAAANEAQSTSAARRKLLALFTAIGDNSNLTLDPDLDSYYAMAVVVDSAPRTMLAAAELRDFIAQNRNTQSELPLLLTRCIDASEAMSQSLQRAEHATPSLQQAFARDEWESARTELSRLSEQASTDGDTQRTLANATEQLIAKTSQVMERSTKALDELLDKRIEGFQARRNFILALVLACCVLSAYFISSFYFSSIRGFAALAGRMKKLARGDLSPNYAATGHDEIGSLINSFDNSREQLERLVSRIQQTADSIGTAGRQIATANSDLAERGSAQSAVIGQTSERVKQISDKAQSNLGNSAEANRLAERAYDTAERGKQVVDNVVQTMGAMTESSHRIEAIIGVINEIAFQTNLLALNAAVEAACAGEQRRGFAVVAGEVRSLAQRSANAANEIKTLIRKSVEDVNRGAELVSMAGTTMNDILQSVRSVSQLMTQTTQASETQAADITAVEHAVSKIDDDAQQNAAIVEETAAAAGLLKDQVMLLLDSVRHFTVSGQPQTGAVPSHPARAMPGEGDLPIARVA